MILSNRCSYGPSLVLIRNLSISSQLDYNPYKVLGLGPSATRSEIKSAFYELSKKHHPDKNHGCEKSAKKFRDITAAYEILRDEKLRMKYDRDLYGNHMSGSAYSGSKDDYNDEAERSFYERTSRMKHKHYRKTKYYDFDAWYREHYVNSTVYKQYSNQKVYNHAPHKSNYKIKSGGGYTLYVIIGALLVLLFSFSSTGK